MVRKKRQSNMVKRHLELPALNPEYIKKQEYFLLFESSLYDRENYKSFIFSKPIDIIEVRNFCRVEEAFEKIEKYSLKYYIAGYFAYELGYYFEKGIFNLPASYPSPLIRLCVFDRAVTFNHKTGRTDIKLPGLFAKGEWSGRQYRLDNLRLNFTRPLYLRKLARIKSYIRKGSTYQVNFTGKYQFDLSGSPLSLYQDLKLNQNTPYGSFCKFKDDYVISLSPELYFRKDKERIYSRPIKGTIARGRDIEEDKEQIAQLKRSVKDTAENLMIVDLIRNDLGRVCRVSSIRTAGLFSVEKYNTLFQLTSTVKGTLRKGTTYLDIFRSIFPGGSVTGAPKISSMRIIRELERGYRKVYCGALGIIRPQGRAVFNLPIRTISLSGNKAEMGVGSGIVIDSLPNKEFQECSLKAKFLVERTKEFSLIETILWEKGYRFLEEHLRRIARSAEYFDFYSQPREIVSSLKCTEKKFLGNERYKIRLLLGKNGKFRVEYSLLKDDPSHLEKLVILSKKKLDPAGIWLYHKTTNRALYDSEYAYYRRKGYYEVAFLNSRNEFTEGSFSNIIIQSRGKYYTPALSSGLLPGIFRAYLLKSKLVTEKVIGLKEVESADKVYLCNSVRGMVEVKIKP
ncbi:MAG TPA: aminodeoxychorismate synthase component I [Candidatus Margulisiibacteriota bacterium]|nr:aminodeoxychorismate synthase component I [Candidatus Margulisiibacteriota bacterium]